MKRTVSLLFVTLLLITAYPAQGQEVQSPSEFLGYELGSRFTRHHQIMSYVGHVGQHSDRVLVEPYGKTNEGRQLSLVFISAPENLTNLEQIRRDNLRRAHLHEGEPEGAKKAIVWLSYNVHGNESNSSEAAMATLHRLVDMSDEEVASWLANTVVIMDPAINPDGRDQIGRAHV